MIMMDYENNFFEPDKTYFEPAEDDYSLMM